MDLRLLSMDLKYISKLLCAEVVIIFTITTAAATTILLSQLLRHEGWDPGSACQHKYQFFITARSDCASVHWHSVHWLADGFAILNVKYFVQYSCP